MLMLVKFRRQKFVYCINIPLFQTFAKTVHTASLHANNLRIFEILSSKCEEEVGRKSMDGIANILAF